MIKDGYISATVTGGNISKVKLTDITHAIANDKYVDVYHDDGVLMVRETLSLILASSSEFTRVDRAAIVATRLISGLKKGREDGWFKIIVAGVGEVRCSRRRGREVMHHLGL